MPPLHFDEIVHKALANDIRSSILLILGKGDKYLSEIANDIGKPPQTIDFHLQLLEEIGLVSSESKEGKKYYSLKNKKILDFLRAGKPVPPEARPRPPHELVLEELNEIKKILNRMEKKIDSK